MRAVVALSDKILPCEFGIDGVEKNLAAEAVVVGNLENSGGIILKNKVVVLVPSDKRIHYSL